MKNKLEDFNKSQYERLMEGKSLPDIRTGQTVRVHYEITEGNNKRIQIFEGLCIAVRHNHYRISIVVRKISHGEGVERVFALYSPKVQKVEVVKVGKVRQAKIYYIRELRGKKARIEEKADYKKQDKNAK